MLYRSNGFSIDKKVYESGVKITPDELEDWQINMLLGNGWLSVESDSDVENAEFEDVDDVDDIDDSDVDVDIFETMEREELVDYLIENTEYTALNLKGKQVETLKKLARGEN